jgi:hypothetical protein
MERVEFTAIRLFVGVFKQATFYSLPMRAIIINMVDMGKVDRFGIQNFGGEYH